MRKIEVTGVNQKQMESIFHRKIHEINASLKKYLKVYDDFDNTDEKVKQYYKTKENYYLKVIVPLKETRTYYVKKLNNIRNGFAYD